MIFLIKLIMIVFKHLGEFKQIYHSDESKKFIYIDSKNSLLN